MVKVSAPTSFTSVPLLTKSNHWPFWYLGSLEKGEGETPKQKSPELLPSWHQRAWGVKKHLKSHHTAMLFGPLIYSKLCFSTLPQPHHDYLGMRNTHLLSGSGLFPAVPWFFHTACVPYPFELTPQQQKHWIGPCYSTPQAQYQNLSEPSIQKFWRKFCSCKWSHLLAWKDHLPKKSIVGHSSSL